MFDLDHLVADCRSAAGAEDGDRVLRELVTRAVEDPSELIAALGEPRQSGLVAIYRSPDLTILNLVWKPCFTVMPHNHEMPAVIGIYGGREDNIFWRRIKDAPEGQIEAVGAKALATGDVAHLGRDIIHSVTNPIDKLTGAIHVYRGDFFAAERSEWDPESLTERPYDLERVKAMFAD